jgi:hypothetical protein
MNDCAEYIAETRDALLLKLVIGELRVEKVGEFREDMT